MTFHGSNPSITMAGGFISGLPYNAQSTGLGTFNGIQISPAMINGVQASATGNHFPWVINAWISTTNSFCPLTEYSNK